MIYQGPWMCNCIGLKNRAHFARFLGSVSFGTLYSLYFLFLRLSLLLFNQDYRYQHQRIPYFLGFRYDLVYPHSQTELVIFCIVVIVLFLLILSVGILTVYQFAYIAHGKTTIESFEQDRLNQLVEKDILKEKKAIFPFDNGVYANMCEVFGDKWYLWWLPQSSQEDGIHFKVNEHYENNRVVVWPPSEYYRYKTDPNWKGESDSGSDSSIGYDSEWYNEDVTDILPESEMKIESTRDTRHGDEGLEVKSNSLLCNARKEKTG